MHTEKSKERAAVRKRPAKVVFEAPGQNSKYR